MIWPKDLSFNQVWIQAGAHPVTPPPPPEKKTPPKNYFFGELGGI